MQNTFPKDIKDCMKGGILSIFILKRYNIFGGFM